MISDVWICIGEILPMVIMSGIIPVTSPQLSIGIGTQTRTTSGRLSIKINAWSGQAVHPIKAQG